MKLRFTAELIDDNGELVSRRTEVEARAKANQQEYHGNQYEE